MQSTRPYRHEVELPRLGCRANAFSGEVAESAPAHTIGNKVQAAYRDMIYPQKRRGLMDAWANFLKPLHSDPRSNSLEAFQDESGTVGLYVRL